MNDIDDLTWKTFETQNCYFQLQIWSIKTKEKVRI